MNQEIEKIYNILVLILGESKTPYDNRITQYQFPCPRCVENKGYKEKTKYNLEVNLQKHVFKCWACESESSDMHGSLARLIRKYGNEKLLQEYKSILFSIKESNLYKLNFGNDISADVIEREEIRFPETFRRFRKDEDNNKTALNYLMERGIGWDIIEEYKIGYTEKETDPKLRKYSYRVIIPSYNDLGELNYWVARDYLPNTNKKPSKRTKYANPKVDKKSIIFNEEKIQWDADIILVEGTFDHIVVPNSIPLLGKVLNKDFKLYFDIITKCNANVILWLDNDAHESAVQLYSTLNHGNLYGKVKMIETRLDKDASDIYQKYGKKGIVQCLKMAKRLPEIQLVL
jgi:DNA primase